MAEFENHRSDFELYPSRLAMIFQLFFLAVLWECLWQVLSVGVWLVAVIISVLVLIVFLKQAKKVQFLQPLTEQVWSLKYFHSNEVYSTEIIKMLDHHYYAVVYFSEKTHSPLIIWQDQMPKSQWKTLKTHIKLQ